MTVERLHFGQGAEPVNAMDAAEDFIRYAAAKGLAPGRRVLDIACGEGYGTWLLREWGANEVIDVDVSDDRGREAHQPLLSAAFDAFALVRLH